MTFFKQFKIFLLMGFFTLSSGLSYASSQEWFDSIRTRNIGAIKELIRNLVDINQVGPEGLSAFMLAVGSGHTEVVEELIKAGVNLNQKDLVGNTALMNSAENGYLEVVKLLINSGADINEIVDFKCVDEDNEEEIGRDPITALMSAAMNGHADIVNILISRGANIYLKQAEGFHSAFMIAAANGHVEIVKKLLLAGANVNQRNSDGQTVLMEAAANGHLRVVDILIRNGADIDKIDNEDIRRTALIWASMRKKADVVSLLIDKGANTDFVSIFGYNALMVAIESGDLDTIKAFIGKEVFLDQADETGLTPLLYCIKGHNMCGSKELVKAGADLEKVDLFGETPLICAVRHGGIDFVQLLVSAGIDFEKSDLDDMTALEWAILDSKEEIAKVLLERGALPLDKEKVAWLANDKKKIITNNLDLHKKYTDAVGDCFEKAMPTAVVRGLMWKMLYGKKGVKTSLGIQLSHAVQETNFKKVQRVLSEGANVNFVGYDGKTAMMHASGLGNSRIVDLLQKSQASLRARRLLSRPVLLGADGDAIMLESSSDDEDAGLPLRKRQKIQ